MPALDLSGVTQFPYTSSTTTPGSTNVCRIVLLPVGVPLKLTLHNRDKSSKDLVMSFDQTLTDGGAAPATYFEIEDPCSIRCGANRRSGFASVTQVALFSPSHSAVNCEILLEEGAL